MRKKRILLFVVAAGVFFTGNVFAGPFDYPGDEDEMEMIKGDLETIVTENLTRVSVTNPEIADIANIDQHHILMLARQVGQTTLFVWDKYGKRSVVIHVVSEDLNTVKTRIQQLLARSNIASMQDVVIEVDKKEGKVIISGQLPEKDKGELEALLAPFSDDVLNLTKEKEDTDLVQIDAQITELNTTLSKQLGVDWSSALTYGETKPSGTIHDAMDIIKLGKFSRTAAILSTINFLVSEGKGRVLSKPKLVCVSGKEASFLVGGEVPISQTSTSSGGNVQQNVKFKDFGVGLTIRPTIKNDKIDIGLEIEVSDVDAANSFGGQPAFTTRNAQTQLFLDNKQTVILAGLIKHNTGSTVRKVPLLGDIPLAGAFFRSKKTATPNTETELVISLTPTILTPARRITADDYKVTTGDIVAQGAAQNQPQEISSTRSQVAQEAMTTKAYIPEEMVPYIKMIQEKIAQQIVYPEQARRYGWEGTVKLALHILNDGTLASASVRESSGYDLFDENALNIAKNLAPYSIFPAELNLQDLTITVPIVYSLDNK